MTRARLAAVFLLVMGTLPALSAAASAPTLLGSFDTTGRRNANTVAVSGTYAYLGTDQNSGGPEFYVVNIANPASPSIVGSREIGGNVSQIVVAGTLAYLATSHDATELLILDAATPSSPTQAGAYNATNGANGLALAVSGTTVYLGTQNKHGSGNHEFYILNAANPANVVKLGSYNVDGDVHALALNSTDAYLATGHNSRELCILNVAIPSSIAMEASYDTPGTGDAHGIAYRNGKVYLVTNNNGSSPDFFVFQAPPSLALLGAVNLGAMNTAVAVYRDRAYVTSKTNGKSLIIVAITNPAQPTLLTSYRSQGNGLGVTVNGPRTYLASANNTQELQILDTTFLLRPNIVVIMTDDQRWDTLQYMPSVEEDLVSQGVTFTNAFYPTPHCCPSRASFLTGQYAHNTGILTNRFPLGGAGKFIGKDASTIATWLRNMGYRTGIYGKYMTEYNLLCPPYKASCYVPPGWDEWHPFVQQKYYDYQLVENDGSTVSYGSSAADYSTDVLKTKAVQFISTADERPFFLFFTPQAPHSEGALPPLVAPRHKDMFANIAPWRPVSYDEEDVSDKPLVVQQAHRADEPFAIWLTYGSWTDAWRITQLESLQAVDEAVGELIDALESIGQAQDTMVVYLSDNGFNWFEHRYITKACEYDECIRAPLVIRYPRWISTPRQEDRLTLNLDLAPTMAEVAGAVPASSVNGLSLVPLLKNQTPTSWRFDFLLERWNEETPSMEYEGVRSLQWKYVYYPGTGEEQLYDLVNDPYEMQSAASDPNPIYQDIKAAYQARLNSLKQE